MPVTLVGESKQYSIPGNQLSPDYFGINASGKVVIKNDDLGSLLKQYIENPPLDPPQALALIIVVIFRS